jgi:hypothetical protein
MTVVPSWELVDAEHLEGAPAAQRQPGLLEVLRGARAGRGPDDVGEDVEDAVEIDAVRSHKAMREQVQAQIRVRRVGRGCVQFDLAQHDVEPDPAIADAFLRAGQRGEFVRRRGGARRVTEARRRVPGVEHPADGVAGCDRRGEAVAPRLPHRVGHVSHVGHCAW